MLDSGRWGLLILGTVAISIVAVEMTLFRASLGGALRRLGLGRPGGRSLVLAAGVSAAVLVVYPVSAAVSGEAVHLRPDWPWLLVGLLAFHGLAEELVWRGYAFRRLREGRSFPAAVWLTMPLIAATHLPIVVSLGPAVGIGAMLVAAVTSLPFSYLYETGRRTVWAPALVHSAIDSFTLVVIPAAALTTFPLLLVGISLTVPLLAIVAPRRLVTAREEPTSGRSSPAHGERPARR